VIAFIKIESSFVVRDLPRLRYRRADQPESRLYGEIKHKFLDVSVLSSTNQLEPGSARPLARHEHYALCKPSGAFLAG